MNNVFLFLSFLAMLITGCTHQTGNINTNAKTLNRQWLDSIIKQSDSSYTKPYKRTDYVRAVSYVHKKDSSVCQVMKDSADSIRQIIIARKNVRTFFAQYFANGNVQADLPLDEFGQYHGTGTFYFEDGTVQSTGAFDHSFKSGQWKVYDKKGKLTETQRFDANGQLIQQQQP